MAVERKVFDRKGQHLVALPVTIRDHLKTSPGITVYWRVGRKGEAIVSRKDRAARGPVTRARCPSCEAYVKELEKLKQRTQARDLTLYGQGYAAGALATRELLTHPNGPAATVVRERHRAWQSAPLSRRERRSRKASTEAPPGKPNVKCWGCGKPYAAHKRADHAWHASPLSASADAIPSPSPSPSPTFSGGAEASGGDTPQASH